MPDAIIDSKYRVLEDLPRVAGRNRYLVSDLISGRMAVLEHVPLEGFDRLKDQWVSFWQPSLRERAARFSKLSTVVKVEAVGAWELGPYYVYEDDQEEALQGRPPHRLPSKQQVKEILADFASAGDRGDQFQNLRPEHLCIEEDSVRILPGAWILPLELLARSASRSPYQPPELRHAGHPDATTSGYMLAFVLEAMGDRSTDARPAWWSALVPLQYLEPSMRHTPAQVIAALETDSQHKKVPPVRRSVERLAELISHHDADDQSWRRALESLENGISNLVEGRSKVVVLEGPENGAGLPALFERLRVSLHLLSERPRVVVVDPLTNLQVRDIAVGGNLVILVPDWQPQDPELLPVEVLLSQEKLRPCVFVLGIRRGLKLEHQGESCDVQTWVTKECAADLEVELCDVRNLSPANPVAPTSPAANHLLDLLAILEVDATVELLRRALPQQEFVLSDAVAELAESGHVQTLLAAHGWWGDELRLVLRAMRPDQLAMRRQALTTHRREELHLLLSHLLADSASNTLGARYLRFQHLFAGGDWDAAAEECSPLLRVVQKRGLDSLVRTLQRTLVNSNLAHHFTAERLLDVLRSLGSWEVAQNRTAQAQSYFERACERLFGLSNDEKTSLDLSSVSEMIFTYADLMERHGNYDRALELLGKYLDQFDESLSASGRGRAYSEMGYCEFRLSRYSAAEERCQVALKLLDARNQPGDVAQVYSVLGLVRWKTSRYDEAEQYFNSSMALREKSGDRLAMARIYNNLGLLERSRRRFAEALEFHRKSMEIRQELDDHEGVTRSLLNLAWAHYEMQDHAHAEELAARAGRRSQELGLRSLSAAAKGLQGEIYLALERYEEARDALQEAIEQARNVGDQAELFMDLRKLATVELRSGELQRAAELLEESEEYLPMAASPLEEANWYLTQADLRIAQRDIRGAAASFEHAGNNLARLGHSQRAGEVFIKATQGYYDSDVMPRARELAARARELFVRDGLVLPTELADLEASLGSAEAPAASVSDTERGVAFLRRVCTAAASSSSEAVAVQEILGEMRSMSSAKCAILVRESGRPHRSSVVSPALMERNIRPEELVEEKPLLFSKALKSLLPLSSQDTADVDTERTFYVIPVEIRQVHRGCVYLEWDTGAALPSEGVRQGLQSMTQILGLGLEHQQAATSTVSARVGTAGVDEEGRDETRLDNIIGRSAARQAVVDFVRQVRDLDATVLLLGENGTGKEVAARAIHYTSDRRRYPFVTVNCTAIPEGLWERELFGHERGSFTDAHESKRGYFEAAHRGTLLLDEIGDMPWNMQTKFLRVLEDKSFTRIGGTELRQVDVRIIAATNQDLEAAMQAGRFRRDLFHRLNVLVVTLPPLRERREDIPELAQHFLGIHAEQMRLPPKRLSGEALRILMRYHWPGNIRELENAMKGSLVLADREVLVPEVLPAAILRGAEGRESSGSMDLDHVARWVVEHAHYSVRNPLMANLEKAVARQLVEKVGEKTMSARLLGISKPTLYNRLKDPNR